MSKKKIVFIILTAVVFSWLFNIFPGRLIAAKISTWPLLNRWKILSPLAPIVINNRETIRISDSGDVQAAAAAVKSKISLVVKVKDNIASVAGGAVNLTADGIFVTAASTFSQKTGESFYALLNDGRQAAIIEKVLDPATSLAFFRASLSGVPVASLGESKNINPGEKVIFIHNSFQNFNTQIFAGYVNSGQTDTAGQTFSSDLPRRSFEAATENVTYGQAIVDTKGEIVGLWNGNTIISSDVLKQVMSLYFNNQRQIIRPSFGFFYSVIGVNHSKLTGQPEGIKIVEVTSSGPAYKAGLQTGDIIIDVDGVKISEENPTEEILQKYRPGDKVFLDVMRGKQSTAITLTAGELK